MNETIWEGRVWKEILTPGTSRISLKPAEGSVCLLKIENISRNDNDDESRSLELAIRPFHGNTTILTGESQISFTIGEADCELDRRIEMAIRLMKDCEKSRITIIPGDNEIEKITFEATLLEHERFKPLWEWTPEEKFDVAMKYKNIGVKLFKESECTKESELGLIRCKDAFYRFSRACKILITLEPMDDSNIGEDLSDNIMNLRLKLYKNMAVCQSRHRNYYHVIELCGKVLARDEKNATVLYRRGCAYGELKDNERAVKDFTKVLSIDPGDKQAIFKLEHYKACLRQADKDCNEMVKRMFK